jgi:hypothetical protein
VSSTPEQSAPPEEITVSRSDLHAVLHSTSSMDELRRQTRARERLKGMLKGWPICPACVLPINPESPTSNLGGGSDLHADCAREVWSD